MFADDGHAQRASEHTLAIVLLAYLAVSVVIRGCTARRPRAEGDSAGALQRWQNTSHKDIAPVASFRSLPPRHRQHTSPLLGSGKLSQTSSLAFVSDNDDIDHLIKQCEAGLTASDLLMFGGQHQLFCKQWFNPIDAKRKGKSSKKVVGEVTAITDGDGMKAYL